MSASIGKDGVQGEVPEPPAKEPQPWDSWFKEALADVRDAIRSSAKGKLSKELLTQKRLGDAHRAVRRGVLTKEFLAGEFWNDFLHPAIGEEQTLKPWAPGDPTDHMSIVTTHIFSSGIAALAKRLLAKFADWVKVGEDAKRVIAEDTERRRRVAELGRE